jgi:hypothetical protein
MTPKLPTYAAPLACAAAAAQLVFIGSFLVAGAAEGHGYDAMRHDISDLGALTAHHATPFLLALFGTGAVTMAFGLLVVSRLLGPTSGVLVALSLPGFDNLTDTFFRLDCRAADAGCSTSEAVSSWHGLLHMVCFGVAALATVAAPFVAARAMRRTGVWQEKAAAARWFGVLTIGLLTATGAASGSPVQGAAQRVAATVIPLGLAGFALLVARREARVPRVAGLMGGR